MKISVVIAIYNRADLLLYGLDSLRLQTFDPRQFEVIVVDQNSNDNAKEIVMESRIKNVKYIRINPSNWYRADELYHGPYLNPALQQNVGIRQAKGDIVVLTSPEIVHARTNLEHIYGYMAGQTIENCSVYGEVFESPRPWIDALPDTTLESLQNLPQGVTLMPNLEGERRISAYFIGGFWKQNLEFIGGLDEDYMAGIAFEDDDFGLRMGAIAKPVVLKNVLGIHIPHDRGYQRDIGWAKNSDTYYRKIGPGQRLVNDYLKVSDPVANKEQPWGDEDLIVELETT